MNEFTGAVKIKSLQDLGIPGKSFFINSVLLLRRNFPPRNAGKSTSAVEVFSMSLMTNQTVIQTLTDPHDDEKML